MNTLKLLHMVLAAALGLSLVVTAQAQEKATEIKVAQATQAADMTDGEIRKIDKENKKITIKHGEIKNCVFHAIPDTVPL